MRDSVPALDVGSTESWGPACRWWGTGLDRKPLEVDIVAENLTGDRLLVGEAKWTTMSTGKPVLAELERKIERLPFVNQREVIPILWLASRPQDLPSHRWSRHNRSSLSCAENNRQGTSAGR